MRSSPRVLIAGCGDLGSRIGLLLAAEGAEVFGLRRSIEQLPPPIRGIAGDLSVAGGLRGLEGDWDLLIYAAAAGERSEAGYRTIYVDGVQRLLDAAGPVARLLMVSSTAVYGQDDGQWVDETSPTEPQRFNGRLLLEAETRLRERRADAIVVRPSGLYGPGRTRLIERARQVAEAAPRWTNRIHIEDAAAAVQHILRLSRPAPLWLLNDDQPAAEAEVLGALRAQLGLPQVTDTGTALRGRRVSNARLRASGFACRFPGFREGYAELLRGLRSLL